MLPFLLLAKLLVAVRAQKVGVRSTVGFGCWNAAFKWNFTCPYEIGWLPCHCHNDLFLATALNCINDYALSNEQINAGYRYIRDQCHYWGNRSLDNRELGEIYSQHVQSLIKAEEITPGTIVTSPVIIPRELFDKEQNAAVEMKSHYRLGTIFGCVIIAFWALVILIVSIVQYTSLARPDKNQAKNTNRIRKYLSLPALIGDKHHTPYHVFHLFHITAPTRGQALIIILFLVINIVSLAICYNVNDGIPMTFVSRGEKLARFLGNRTGIIAFSYLPVTTLFACRNNPFILTTGWSYDTFMVFHRWCARMCLVHSIIHGSLFTWASVQEGILGFKWGHVHNWRGGNVGVYAMILMIVTSIRAFRARLYEVFLFAHRVLFIIAMVCMIVHCGDFGWMGWIWATVAIYFTEHLLRIGRTLHSGGLVEATFTLASYEMFRIRVNGRRNWVIYPGQYAYIRIFDRRLFWQSHPFSVFQAARGKTQNSLEIIVRGKSGMTKTVMDYLKKQPGGVAKYKVLLEGPYGHCNTITTYDNVLVLAGGIGITAMYSYVEAMAPDLREDQHLSLMWVIGNEKLLHSFDEELVRLMEFQNIVDIQIYLTQSTSQGKVIARYSHAPSQTSLTSVQSKRISPSSVDLLKSSSKEETVLQHETYSSRELSENLELSLDNVIQYGRPNIDETVEQFIKVTEGSKAILSCGPPTFVDLCRDSIVSNIQNSPWRVDYFEEAFSW